ncbi:MAG: hypothetical protein BZ137_03395 [Methanosphaera sp. rholeuAM130]|nr:MAG: hypothetical protein BZ137_03395 [Methanosphaera sp. rholeuAM130]
MPLNYVYLDNKLYFHGALKGHKIDGIRGHEKVSFCIVDDGRKLGDNWWFTFKSVICFGIIREVQDEGKILSVLNLFADKYFPESVSANDEIEKHVDHTLILELDIEHVSGKLVNEK